MRKPAALISLIAAVALASAARPAAQPQRNPGVSTVCGTFTIDLDFYFASVSVYELDDEAWAYVDATQKRRQATGAAHNTRVAAIDSFSNHDSHDVDFEIELDPGQDDLLSIQEKNALGVEWESGIRPFEHTGDGAHPTFPKWMWPSDGDRVWAEGNWIFDCGHPEGGLFKTEIHPPRAVAVMREQAAPLPGTGITPVPVILTDLYISGRGGFTPNQLNCGPHITLGSHPNTCGQSPPPADDSYKTTPIDDNYAFNVCLPPRPANAVFTKRVDIGPRNSVGIEPQIHEVAATGACATDDGFDHDRMMTVFVPLNNTNTPPEAVYARRIYAGWLVPPAEPLPHRRVTINSTNLTEDHDLDPGDGELSFWWVNVNRSEQAWLRLSDFANGDMNDYDDETAFGDGEMSYTGASTDFYVRADHGFTIRSRGYEQDCYDTIGAFGSHQFLLAVYAACFLDLPNQSSSDDISNLDAAFTLDDSGTRSIHTSDYDMRVTVEEIPLALEDTSYLSIGTGCTPAGEVALVGSPFTCTTRVDNAGPGLPRQVTVRSNFISGPATTANSGSWSVPGIFGNGSYPCAPSGSESVCQPTSVPVAGGVFVRAITVGTPSSPGIVTERAEVTTVSDDPDLSNNVATTTVEVYLPVTIDIEPRDAANVVNLKRGGTVTTAIITTPTFNAATIDPASICFGDAETPAERACTERHGIGHLEDVNKDKLPDMVLHFAVENTGIDLGDTQACVKGRTVTGTGVYSCQVVVVR